MIASVAGDVIGLFLGVVGIVLGAAAWFIKITSDMRDRITRLETKFEEHYWHDRPGKED
jgi:hypothetical protein